MPFSTLFRTTLALDNNLEIFDVMSTSSLNNSLALNCQHGFHNSLLLANFNFAKPCEDEISFSIYNIIPKANFFCCFKHKSTKIFGLTVLKINKDLII